MFLAPQGSSAQSVIKKVENDQKRSKHVHKHVKTWYKYDHNAPTVQYWDPHLIG